MVENTTCISFQVLVNCQTYILSAKHSRWVGKTMRKIELFLFNIQFINRHETRPIRVRNRHARTELTSFPVIPHPATHPLTRPRSQPTDTLALKVSLVFKYPIGLGRCGSWIWRSVVERDDSWEAFKKCLGWQLLLWHGTKLGYPRRRVANWQWVPCKGHPECSEF